LDWVIFQFLLCDRFSRESAQLFFDQVDRSFHILGIDPAETSQEPFSIQALRLVDA
jgi:hypothetical protein